MSEGWRTTTLGSVITLQRGFDLTQKTACPGPFPVISSGGFAYSHNEAKVKGPGVVTGRKGVLGKVHYCETDFWPHDTTLWVKDYRGSHPRFIYYLLHTLPLSDLDAGASNPTLNRNHAHLLPVFVPEIRTQEVIASILGSIDDLIENNRRRIEVLEEMAQAIYREWFVHFRYPGHEDATFVDSPLGPIPDGWEVHRASDALTINPRTKSLKDIDDPFITMGDLDERGMACFPSEMKSGTSGSKFINGDTLFARITPCLENGKTGFVACLGESQVGRGSTEFIVLRGSMVGPAFTTFSLG